jgi:hypothetical protein
VSCAVEISEHHGERQFAEELSDPFNAITDPLSEQHILSGHQRQRAGRRRPVLPSIIRPPRCGRRGPEAGIQTRSSEVGFWLRCPTLIRPPGCYARQRTCRSAAASTFFASSIDLALARTIHGDRKRWARARSQRRWRLCSARSRRMTCRRPTVMGSGGPGSSTSETRSSTSAVQTERR